MTVAVRHFSADGATAITGEEWPNANAGETQDAAKFLLENVGARELETLIGTLVQVGTNDGKSQFRWALDTATLSRPYGVSIALSAAGAGGVWGSTGTRGYRITAYNATGETVGSIEVTVDIDVVTKKATPSWTEILGADGYKVYRTDVPGTYGASTLRTTIGSGAITSFLDDGSATAAGTPPAANTTAGAGPDYGTAPALGTADLAIGDVAIGQQISYWCNRVIPVSAGEEDNPRRSIRRFYEG